MARIVIGGKYQNQIAFQGNKRFLPATIRGIVNAYFNTWNTLKDTATLPALMDELGLAGAGRYFPDTEWEKLTAHYTDYMERNSLTLSTQGFGDKLTFVFKPKLTTPARPIEALLKQYCSSDGVLLDPFDVWAVEKLLRRNKAQLKFDGTFGTALKSFGATAISFEASLSFFMQIQAYHAAEFLLPELKKLLKPHIDDVHTLGNPLGLAKLAAELKQAGANIRVHVSIDEVIEHQQTLLAAALPLELEIPTASDTRVSSALEGKLKVELYPFQSEGVAFLVVNGRALLADDMGLGKTLQAIAAALYLKHKQGGKRVLVVCPASLKYQWQAEIHRFTSERCEVIGGTKAEREAVYRGAAVKGGFIEPEDRPLFFVINYELVYRDIELLKDMGIDLLILDEAQRVKNFRTKTAKAVFDLPVENVFVLTGTPLENQLMELYTIMRFVDHRALGKNPVAFRDRYVLTDRFGGITGYRLIEEVARKIASLTLRRTRDQVLSQLPPLVESDRWLELTDVQRKIYKELQGQAREVLSDSVWDSAKANNAMVLVQRLREVCDTPELIDPKHKESEKLTELLSIIDDEVGALDRQVIIFTQWTRMAEIILRELKSKDMQTGFLHGGVKAEDRQQLVDQFREGNSRVFLSTDAGGTGLNLQAASLVINYDLPFNPAKLNQRIARAHRMGQQNTVLVVNLLCRNTVEHRLMAILREKQALFDDVFGNISNPDELSKAKGSQRSMRELLTQLVD